MVDVPQYQVMPGSSVRLADRPTGDAGSGVAASARERQTRATMERLYERHVLLNADQRYAVLVILQGMDAAGKDPVTRHLSLGMHLLAAKAEKFNAASKEEQKHDLFWRFHPRLPEAGWVTIFNRSWYEGVLADRIEERVPAAVWRGRYDQFNAFEQILVQNNTRVLKCFLHLSKAEQKRRLEERLQNPRKHWLFSANDVEERKRWPRHMQAYEDTITNCSTEYAPWYIVPGNKKWFRNLVIARTIVDTLTALDPQFPPLDGKYKGIEVK